MQHEKIRRMIQAAMFAALTAAAAQLVLPLWFTPVPFSFLMAAVFLSGALLRPRTAFYAQLAYLLLGAAGAPVFSYLSGGLHKLAGPTGGYLLACPLTAWMISLLLARWGRGFWRCCAAMAVGLAVCYAVGTVQLMAVAGVGLWQGLMSGVLPFLPFDLVKIVFAAALAGLLCRVLARAQITIG